MRILNEEELAILLYQTDNQILTSDDRRAMGIAEPPDWHNQAEFNRDDYRAQARLILKQARVAAYPDPTQVQDSP